MKTVVRENLGIESAITDKGNFCVVQIIRVWQATNGDADDFEEAILTFSKQFSCNDHAKAFMKSFMFKSVLKAVEKSEFKPYEKK